MKIRSKFWFVVVLLVGATMFLIACLKTLVLDSTADDESSRKAFQNHKDQFCELRTMLVKDVKLSSVAKELGYFRDDDGATHLILWRDSSGKQISDEELSQTGISWARLKQYLRLMGTIEVHYVEFDRSNSIVYYMIGSNSTLFKFGTKFICYCPNGIPPGYQLVADTGSKQDNDHVCSQIEKDWYILRNSSGKD